MAFENLKSTGISYLLTRLKDYFLQIKDAVRSVNGNEPDGTGNIQINSVPYAQNLNQAFHRGIMIRSFFARLAVRTALRMAMRGWWTLKATMFMKDLFQRF